MLASQTVKRVRGFKYHIHLHAETEFSKLNSLKTRGAWTDLHCSLFHTFAAVFLPNLPFLELPQIVNKKIEK